MLGEAALCRATTVEHGDERCNHAEPSSTSAHKEPDRMAVLGTSIGRDRIRILGWWSRARDLAAGHRDRNGGRRAVVDGEGVQGLGETTIRNDTSAAAGRRVRGEKRTGAGVAGGDPGVRDRELIDETILTDGVHGDKRLSKRSDGRAETTVVGPEEMELEPVEAHPAVCGARAADNEERRGDRVLDERKVAGGDGEMTLKLEGGAVVDRRVDCVGVGGEIGVRGATAVDEMSVVEVRTRGVDPSRGSRGGRLHKSEAAIKRAVDVRRWSQVTRDAPEEHHCIVSAEKDTHET